VIELLIEVNTSQAV